MPDEQVEAVQRQMLIGLDKCFWEGAATQVLVSHVGRALRAYRRIKLQGRQRARNAAAIA